ncbi:MAG: molybdate ABC transporter substrate-binding protein [Pseudomonadota bacterium]
MLSESAPVLVTLLNPTHICLLVLAIALTPAWAPPANAADGPFIVFAASSLTEPLTEIGKKFRNQTGTEIKFSFAASSSLARQIISGANPAVFFSANKQWMDAIDAQNLLTPESRRTLLSNEIVIAGRADSALEPFSLDATTDFNKLMRKKDRVAIGDPDHVPLGMYVEQRLTTLGLWPNLQTKLARADNARAVLALIERGEVPFGFVYASDLQLTSTLKVLARLPNADANSIAYELALVGKSSSLADAFYSFVNTAMAKKIFTDHGFLWIGKTELVNGNL